MKVHTILVGDIHMTLADGNSPDSQVITNVDSAKAYIYCIVAIKHVNINDLKEENDYLSTGQHWV